MGMDGIKNMRKAQKTHSNIIWDTMHSENTGYGYAFGSERTHNKQTTKGRQVVNASEGLVSHNMGYALASKASEGYGHRGQMFIISAIILIMALFSLTGLLSVYSTGQEKAREEGVTAGKTLLNIVREYKNVAGLAQASGSNASTITYLANFSSLVRNTRNAKVLYAFAFSNGTSQKFSVTAGNFMKDRINMTVSATDSTPSSYVFLMEDKTNSSVEFSRSSNVMINITLSYADSAGAHGEVFALNASSQNSLSFFVDAMVDEDGALMRLKDMYNRSW